MPGGTLNLQIQKALLENGSCRGFITYMVKGSLVADADAQLRTNSLGVGVGSGHGHWGSRTEHKVGKGLRASGFLRLRPSPTSEM